MSNKNQLPPVYPTTDTDSPLDLTVKRSNTDRRHDKSQHSKTITSSSSFASPIYTSGDLHSSEAYAHHLYMAANSRLFFPGSFTQCAHYNSLSPLPVPNHSHVTSIYDINNSMDFRHKSLPKKRKHIWRPYDSNGKRTCQSENNSGSDSDSNSSHDTCKVEHFEDPVKRRKRNMLRFHDGHNVKDTQRVNRRFPHTKQAVSPSSKHSPVDVLDDKAQTKAPVHTGGPKTAHPQEQKDNKYTSGIFSRGIFQWSPNLVESAETIITSAKDLIPLLDMEQSGANGGSESNEPYIHTKNCSDDKSTDRDKCYQGTNTREKGNDDIAEVNHDKLLAQNQMPTGKDNSERHNSDGNEFRDKDDTSDDDENKTAETKKSLSLIDLIEEIEADAMKKEQEEVEKTRQRNANIVKLLEQCNHVKLQALDYLMSNVLIQDNDKTFKSKNEKVQKMLKGDKITSVNMLDVLELQVEMGLN